MFVHRQIYLLSGLVLCLSACSLTKTESSYIPVSAKPIIAKNNLSDKLICYSDTLRKDYYIFENKENIIGLFVKDIVDGTIPINSVHDSSLVDSGRLQLISSLSKLFNNHKEIIVAYSFPRAFDNNEEGINKTGYLSDTVYYELVNGQLFKMNNWIRIPSEYQESNDTKNRVKPVIKAKTADFVIVEGAFSRNDSDDGSMNRGGAGSFEYENEKKTQIGAEIGDTKSKKFLSLTIVLAHPYTNTILDTEIFELAIEKNKGTGELKLGRSNINTGITFEREQIESLHSAQQLLIDYAALWIADVLAQQNPNLFKELQKCSTKQS